MFENLETAITNTMAQSERTETHVFEIRELMGWFNTCVPLMASMMFVVIVLSGILLYQIQQCVEGLNRIENKLDAMEPKRADPPLAKP